MSLNRNGASVFLTPTPNRSDRRPTDTALLAELGLDDPLAIRERINGSLHGCTDFVLLGGPPCQVYSVMGRSRNSGNPNYRATEDKRQRLYVEYLQVLADHHPAIFIMENVKGLLSATLENQHIFERILEDLRSIYEAIIWVMRFFSNRGCYAYCAQGLVPRTTADCVQAVLPDTVRAFTPA